jgi:hypothetical protein
MGIVVWSLTPPTLKASPLLLALGVDADPQQAGEMWTLLLIAGLRCERSHEARSEPPFGRASKVAGGVSSILPHRRPFSFKA